MNIMIKRNNKLVLKKRLHLNSFFVIIDVRIRYFTMILLKVFCKMIFYARFIDNLYEIIY